MKYSVTLERIVIQECSLVVEAANEEEAETIAINKCGEGEWLNETTNAAEVIDVEPINDEADASLT